MAECREFFIFQKLGGAAYASARKTGAEAGAVFVCSEALNQALLHCLLWHGAQGQGHAAAHDRGQKGGSAVRQQNDHGIGRRLLKRLEQGVLGCGSHFFGILQDVNLAGGAVRFHLNVRPHFADVADTYAVLFFPRGKDQVRIAAGCGPQAGHALSACFDAAVHGLRVLTKKSSRKAPGDHMTPGAFCSV